MTNYPFPGHCGATGYPALYSLECADRSNKLLQTLMMKMNKMRIWAVIFIGPPHLLLAYIRSRERKLSFLHCTEQWTGEKEGITNWLQVHWYELEKNPTNLPTGKYQPVSMWREAWMRTFSIELNQILLYGLTWTGTVEGQVVKDVRCSVDALVPMACESIIHFILPRKFA